MPRESGASSNPRRIRWLLDRPLSRAMTPLRIKNPPSSHIRQPKHVGHGIQARLAVSPPQRRLEGSTGKDHAVLCLVDEFDAFVRSGKDHTVVANGRAATQARKADVAGLAGAGVAVADADRMLRKIDVAARSRRCA